MRLSAPVRRGFTLLEVILAVTMALMLLGGLYVAMQTQLTQMDLGREIVEDSSTSRAIFNRIATDLTTSPSPLQPPSSSTTSSSTASSTAAPAMGAGSSASTASIPASIPLPAQIGVQGDNQHLAIYQSRLTRAIVNPPLDANGNPPAITGDVRRVTYFLASNGGVAMQEILQPTSDLTDNPLPNDLDDHSKMLANEVTDLQFRYYDGTNWQDSWDGSTPGPDGVTPQGSPQAVEITLTIQFRDDSKQFRHVVAFPTASGPSTTTSSGTTGTTNP
jgi:prepilin-type N-terminal cleavage/methylation domain-containing protein